MAVIRRPNSDIASTNGGCADYSRALDEVAGDQFFGDLEGVERGPLAQVVADHPEGEPPWMGAVLPDAADEHLVLAGRGPGLRVEADRRVVADDDAGGVAQDGV